MLYSIILYFLLLILTFFSTSIYIYTPTSTPIPIYNTPTATSVPAPTPTIPTVIPTPNTWSIEERELVRLLNEYRGKELIFDANLTNAARWMSNDMYANDRFSHIDSLGRSMGERLSYFGWDKYTGLGENLGIYITTAQLALDSWIVSPEHNALLLNMRYTHVGVSQMKHFWVLEVGYR